MTDHAALILAGFITPLPIGTTPQSLLWMLPLTASVAIVYKAIKLPKITALNFIRETASLFGSIVAFLAVSALVLYVLARFVTE